MADHASQRVTRRRVLRAGAALPALVWTAPVITVMHPPPALAASPLAGAVAAAGAHSVAAESALPARPGKPAPHVVAAAPPMAAGLHVAAGAAVGMTAVATGVAMRVQAEGQRATINDAKLAEPATDEPTP